MGVAILFVGFVQILITPGNPPPPISPVCVRLLAFVMYGTTALASLCQQPLECLNVSAVCTHASWHLSVGAGPFKPLPHNLMRTVL